MTIPPEALALLGTGAKWLAGAGAPIYAAWRVLVHDRTVLYALFPKLGKKVDARKMQETIIAAGQTAYATELKSLGKQIDLLTQKFLKAKPAQRSLIQRDLEYMEGRKREMEIKFAAMKDIAAAPTKDDAKKPTNQSEVISGHWMDQFNELVRRRNEEWRALLLKDALVREAQEPGSITPRILWLIGILEPDKFEILSAILNLASTVDGRPMIVGDNVRLDRRFVPGLGNRRLTMNMATVALEDTGLMAGIEVALGLEKEESVIASYNKSRIRITSLGIDGYISGISFSSLGKILADLYRAKPNAFGQEIFDRWMKDLLPTRFSVSKL